MMCAVHSGKWPTDNYQREGLKTLNPPCFLSSTASALAWVIYQQRADASFLTVLGVGAGSKPHHLLRVSCSIHPTNEDEKASHTGFIQSTLQHHQPTDSSVFQEPTPQCCCLGNAFRTGTLGDTCKPEQFCFRKPSQLWWRLLSLMLLPVTLGKSLLSKNCHMKKFNYYKIIHSWGKY